MSSGELEPRVSGKAVIEAEGGILALHPSEIDNNRNWHIPGGIRDDIEENIINTGIREALEETGIDLSKTASRVFKVSEWPAVDKGERVKILAVFFHFILPKRPHVILSDEHDDLAWLDIGNYTQYPANKEVYEIVEELLTK